MPVPHPPRLSLLQCVQQAQQRLSQAEVALGHGTDNTFDEAAWLVLWCLGLPLETSLLPADASAQQLLTPSQQAQVDKLIDERISSRKPAAYLTQEAWLQGVAFYIDERAIVPRSLIAELLASEALDYWLHEQPQLVLDLCSGGGSLAVLAALCYPQAAIHACDIDAGALAVAHINVQRHQLQQRIELRLGDGLAPAASGYDLILCNPPYVNACSMARLPPEFRAEPQLALAGGADGMDFIRQLLPLAANKMSTNAVLVLEIGHERANFEAAFPHLPAIWLATSAGEDHVLLLTRQALLELA